MTHQAVIKAQSIYDVSGDLAPYQQEFLTSVHRICQSTKRTKETAIYFFGLGSKTFLATAHIADEHEARDLDIALERYEEALEET